MDASLSLDPWCWRTNISLTFVDIVPGDTEQNATFYTETNNKQHTKFDISLLGEYVTEEFMK